MYLIAIIAGAVAAAIVVVLASSNGGALPPLGQGRADRIPWWRFPAIVLTIALIGTAVWLAVAGAVGEDDQCEDAVTSGEDPAWWTCLQEPTAPSSP